MVLITKIKTRIDLVNEALEHLGILGAGQSASAEDYDAVDEHVEPLLAHLEAIDLVSLENLDEIPPEIFHPLSIMLADESALKFGLPGVPVAPGSNTNAWQQAFDDIKLVMYGKPTYEAQKSEYY
jgi:hypothetical protein